MSGGYYDIDEILSEEELIPCQTLLDFSYLGHLNPDNINDNNDYIPEGTCIQMPLWSIQKWCDLNFVQIALPKQYRLKARERMEADPLQLIPGTSSLSNSVVLLQRTNLKYMKYYETGRMIIDLIMTSSPKVKQNILMNHSTDINSRQRRRINKARIEALDQLVNEAKQLQSTLYHLFKGIRMNHLFDWALTIGGNSSIVVEDDLVTSSHNNTNTAASNDILLNKLTDMEKKLFDTCAMSSANHLMWKTYQHYHYLPKQFHYQYPSQHNNVKNPLTINNKNSTATESEDQNHLPSSKRQRNQ
jgi:hypothetical protein